MGNETHTIDISGSMVRNAFEISWRAWCTSTFSSHAVSGPCLDRGGRLARRRTSAMFLFYYSDIYLDMIARIWSVVCIPPFGQHRAHPKSGRKLSHETNPTSLSCSTNTLMRCLLCCGCRCAVVSQVFFEDGLVSAGTGCVSCSVTDCCRGLILASYPRKIRRQHVVPSLTPSWCVGYFV